MLYCVKLYIAWADLVANKLEAQASRSHYEVQVVLQYQQLHFLSNEKHLFKK